MRVFCPVSTHSVFLQRIFPGGCLPCISVLTQAMRDKSSLCLEHLEDLPLHYARTLELWRQQFHANKAKLEQLGFDQTFQRTWDYYFEYCRAGFQSRTLQLLQLVFARPGCSPGLGLVPAQ